METRCIRLSANWQNVCTLARFPLSYYTDSIEAVPQHETIPTAISDFTRAWFNYTLRRAIQVHITFVYEWSCLEMSSFDRLLTLCDLVRLLCLPQIPPGRLGSFIISGTYFSKDTNYWHATVYPKKYAHGFVVLCFVVVVQSFIMNSHEVFIHIHQGCFAGTGAIVRLPQCQWSKPDGYGKISQCITTTKHSKAKTVCIFLGIYCSSF